MNFQKKSLLPLVIAALSFLAFANVHAHRLPEILSFSRSSESGSDPGWIEKSVRRLRLGKGIGPKDPLDRWKAGSEDALLDEVMASSDFSDTLADFLLYFYGQEPKQLRGTPSLTDGDGYADEVFIFPQAIAALKAYYQDGRLFENATKLHAPLYVRPNPLAPASSTPGPTQAARYEKLANYIQSKIDLLPSLSTEAEQLKLCGSLLSGDASNNSNGYYDQIYDIGWSTLISYWFMDPGLGGNLYEKCYISKSLDHFDLLGEMKRLKSFVTYLATQDAAFSIQQYTLRSLNDLKALDLSAFGSAKEPFSLHVRFDINIAPNSLTNLNRKRGAFVLKHYFCDDLNPLNVQIPSDHLNAGPHVSSPSCFSCHYKLDPMAGFFRTYGNYFHPYQMGEKIVFSDLSSTPLSTYLTNWSGPQAVGYIRSSTKPQLNIYGSSIEDLESILGSAREVKQCFVKRAFQYFVDPNQAINPGYLDYLTQHFIADTEQQTSAFAFRNLVKSLLKSSSFHHVNANSDQCYDFDPNSTVSSVPCKVSTLFQKNCLKCHSDSSAKGGLSLERFITLPDGTTGFRHTQDDGSFYTQKQTLQMIMERITSSDPEERMPLRVEMPGSEVEAIYLWANGILNGGGDKK